MIYDEKSDIEYDDLFSNRHLTDSMLLEPGEMDHFGLVKKGQNPAR